MSTVIETTTQITPTWKTNKIQEEILKSIAALYVSLDQILAKLAPQAAVEAGKALLVNKSYYATQAIESPIDLVNAIAQFAANITGNTVSVVGNANKASVVFEGGNPLNKLISLTVLQANQAQALVENFKNGLADLGGQFGFKTEIAQAQPGFVVTFSK